MSDILSGLESEDAPPELLTMPTVTIGGGRRNTVGLGNKRGECSVCGKPAYKGSATKCLEHKGASSTARTSSPGSSEPTVELGADGPRIRTQVPPPPRATPAAVDKNARAVQLETMLLEQVNPLLLQGFAMACKPLASENFYQIQSDNAGNQRMLITEYGNQVILNPIEAKLMGKALAELEGNESLKFLAPMAGPVVPVMYAVAALGVVAFHGYKLAGLRTSLMTQVQTQGYTGPMGVVPDQAPTGTGEPGPVSSGAGDMGVTSPMFRPEDIGG